MLPVRVDFPRRPDEEPRPRFVGHRAVAYPETSRISKIYMTTVQMLVPAIHGVSVHKPGSGGLGHIWTHPVSKSFRSDASERDACIYPAS